MSVLFIARASNNFQLNHQLSFGYSTKKNLFFIRRHSSPFENILREFACRAQTSIVSSFFLLVEIVLSLFSTLIFVWFALRCLSLSDVCCCRLVFQYGDGIHIFMRISMYRFITHRKHTVANSALLRWLLRSFSLCICLSFSFSSLFFFLYNTNNCTLNYKFLPIKLNFFQFFSKISIEIHINLMLSSKNAIEYFSLWVLLLNFFFCSSSKSWTDYLYSGITLIWTRKCTSTYRLEHSHRNIKAMMHRLLTHCLYARYIDLCCVIVYVQLCVYVYVQYFCCVVNGISVCACVRVYTQMMKE